MNIVMAFSPNWADYVKVNVFAIKEHNKVDKIYLLTDGEVTGFPDVCEIVDCSELYDKYITTRTNVTNRYTKYALYILLLPEIVKEDKVLFIDADTICTGNLTELWETDLTGYMMAGAVDTGIQPGYKGVIGLSESDSYINSGVVLFNIPIMREKFGEIIERANTVSYLCPDQCLLNVVAKGMIKEISNKYNSSISTGFADDMRIIHYTGAKRPWVQGIPYWEKWYEAEKRYEIHKGLV